MLSTCVGLISRGSDSRRPKCVVLDNYYDIISRYTIFIVTLIKAFLCYAPSCALISCYLELPFETRHSLTLGRPHLLVTFNPGHMPLLYSLILPMYANGSCKFWNASVRQCLIKGIICNPQPTHHLSGLIEWDEAKHFKWAYERFNSISKWGLSHLNRVVVCYLCHMPWQHVPMSTYME